MHVTTSFMTEEWCTIFWTFGSHVVIVRLAGGKYMTGLWHMSQEPSGEKQCPLREMDGFKPCSDLLMQVLF